ncbi:CG11406 [Drosophila busckii]|uniref:Lipase n=1 Tax=Drosophila busckii TaxID=30019 RepID=A0A0M5IZM9_DROBS|nr:lipase 3 [Drosophila busckii]ALC41874.1 CG11406 [Drosophila busckii]
MANALYTCCLVISAVVALAEICSKAQRAGLSCQQHEVQTADGYQLSMQRIPPPLNASCESQLLPFVLMHGLIGSGADYLVGASALALRLHANCFDVWLPNARGSTASQRHRDMRASDSAFWRFSFHEIGVYDLPAILEHVLQVTGQQQLHYVGHSQGTTVLLVLLSQFPSYNARIASANLLAPVAYLQHMSSAPLLLLANQAAAVQLLLERLGLFELLSARDVTKLGGRRFCGHASSTFALCMLLTSLYVGFSEYPLDRHIFASILETTPASMSRDQLLHFGQLISSGKFQHFDYQSASLNSRYYGQATPPAYNLQNVRIKVQLFYGQHDALTSRKDVQRLAQELRNCRVELYEVLGYNHIDFLFSPTAAQILYEGLIQRAKAIRTNPT